MTAIRMSREEAIRMGIIKPTQVLNNKKDDNRNPFRLPSFAPASSVFVTKRKKPTILKLTQKTKIGIKRGERKIGKKWGSSKTGKWWAGIEKTHDSPAKRAERRKYRRRDIQGIKKEIRKLHLI